MAVIPEQNIVCQQAFEYEDVAGSQTAQVLGGTGAAGDRLERLIVAIDTLGAGGTVGLIDGDGATQVIVPASTPVGVYVIEIQAYSTSGPWKITTGADTIVKAIGHFSA